MFLLATVGFATLSVGLAFVRYGLDAISRTRLVQVGPTGDGNDRISRLLERLDTLRVTVMLLSTTSEACLTVGIFALFSTWLRRDPLSAWVVTCSILTIAMVEVAMCRILPRLFVGKEPERYVRPLLPAVHLASLLLYPLVAALSFWQRLLARGEKTSLDELFTEEIRARIAEGEREGVVAEDTAEMMENVVEFRDVEVSEVMTPRTDIDWLRADESAAVALRTASEKGHSRMPVGEEDSDHIIGVFYVRDAIRWVSDPKELETKKTRDACRKPFFVPESKSVKALLQEFREQKVHIAIVLDEYGGTAGLVTIEDILEEIVGDIDDEYDDSDRPPTLTLIDENRAEVDARAHIDELNDALEIDLPESEDFDTVGGFVFARLGRIPRTGEQVSCDGVQIEVLDADERRVKRLNVTVLSRGSGNGSSAA